MKPHPLNFQYFPTETYAQATRRIEELQSRDSEDIPSVSQTIFMTQGGRTDWVVVWFHGYTSSPFQFKQLGEICHQLGANVLIPRVPYHGQLDPYTNETRHLTARKMRQCVNEAIDIATGLGEKISIGGLSMGGVMTIWAAQFRTEVDVAVPISPALGFEIIPGTLTPLAAELFRFLPNLDRWWDKNNPTADPTRPHTHARISTRALANILWLGLHARRQACKKPPAARQIRMVLNENDHVVNNQYILSMMDLWKNKSKSVHTYSFNDTHSLPHDIVDPTNPKQNIELVYPVLINQIQGIP